MRERSSRPSGTPFLFPLLPRAEARGYYHDAPPGLILPSMFHQQQRKLVLTHTLKHWAIIRRPFGTEFLNEPSHPFERTLGFVTDAEALGYLSQRPSGADSCQLYSTTRAENEFSRTL